MGIFSFFKKIIPCIKTDVIDIVPEFSLRSEFIKYENIDSETELCKLNDVYIKTSHNSYINSIQHFSEASYKALESCIYNGVRAIEIDLWNLQDRPVICHGTMINRKSSLFTTTHIDLDIALRKIRNLIFSDNITDPFFLIIENNMGDNELCQNRAYQSIIDHFGDILWKSPEILHATELRFLKNKVIVITGNGNCGLMNNDIFAKWGYTEGFTNNPQTSISLNSRNEISRIYPTGIKSVLSNNMNPSDGFNKHVSMISMNYQADDVNLRLYKNVFKNRGIIPKNSEMLHFGMK